MPVAELPPALESALGALPNKTLFMSEKNQNAVTVIGLTAVHTPGTTADPDNTDNIQCLDRFVTDWMSILDL